jgi:Uma2 family endonuclease
MNRKTAAVPNSIHWTVEEFYRIVALPSLASRRLQLLCGEILEMLPPGPVHDTVLALAQYLLMSVFCQGYIVRNQCCFPIDDDSDLIPDLAVVEGVPRDYVQFPSRRALLIVEVAESSFDYDTQTKAPLYAAAQIPDYWVIDVNDRRVFVFRDPVASETSPKGYHYGIQVILTEHEMIAPLSAPTACIKVADLLP